MPRYALPLAAAFMLMIATAASAQAPEPRRTIDLDRFMGRWHEILRTPNDHQRDCWAASQVWSRRAPNDFSISQTCRRGARDGLTSPAIRRPRS